MRASARIHGNGLHRKKFFGDPSRSPTPIPVSRPSVLFSRVMEVRTGRAGRRRSKGKAAPRAAFPWGVKGTSLLGVPPVENPKFPCEHWKCGPNFMHSKPFPLLPAPLMLSSHSSFFIS